MEDTHTKGEHEMTTQYYLDNTKEDTSKYIATDGDWWYTGKIGMKQDSAFIKFVSSKASKSYFETANLEQSTPEAIQSDINKSCGMIVDFNKLYKS
jgi:hypothetical protein